MSLQNVAMGKRANPRKVILPKMSLAEMNSTLVYKCFDGQESQPKKLILPKMSLAEINYTVVYKTFRLEEQQQ